MRPYTRDDIWSVPTVVIIYKDIAVDFTYIRLRRTDDMGIADVLLASGLFPERALAVLHMVAGIAHAFKCLLCLTHGGGGHYLVFINSPFRVVEVVLIILPIDIYLRFGVVPEDVFSCTHVFGLKHNGMVVVGIHLILHIDCLEVSVVSEALFGKVDAYPCVCVGTRSVA